MLKEGKPKSFFAHGFFKMEWVKKSEKKLIQGGAGRKNRSDFSY